MKDAWMYRQIFGVEIADIVIDILKEYELDTD